MTVRSGFLLLIILTMSSCTASKTVYHRHDLTISVIEKEFIQKKRAVKIRFYVRKDQMYENSGYLLPSGKEDYVVFQYYDNEQRKFVDLELPIKNISEISFKSGAFEFDRSAKIAGIVALFVAAFIAVGIWIN